ncbi:MAG: protein-L-isoaspartate(D-aspartate) O-methyltransferase [Bacillota bacterium]
MRNAGWNQKAGGFDFRLEEIDSCRTGKGLSKSFCLHITNNTDRRVDGRLVLTAPSGWKISPGSDILMAVKPDGTICAEFETHTEEGYDDSFTINARLETTEGVQTDVTFEIPGIFANAVKQMLERDLKGRGISDPMVLRAMEKVKRHLFIDEEYREEAYDDHPLPIDEGQTISQPYIVALMTETLMIKPGEKVLEIGTGCGYQAAVLAELTDEVYSVEIKKKLAENARRNLDKNGYVNVKTKHGDGYFGWEEYAPYDAIMISCAVKRIPPPLLEQLREGGRMVLPIGDTTYYQDLVHVKKDKGVKITHICGVRFVPITGEAVKDE